MQYHFSSLGGKWLLLISLFTFPVFLFGQKEGDAFFENGKFEKAIEKYESYISSNKKDKDCTPTFVKIIESYKALKKTESCLEYAERGIEHLNHLNGESKESHGDLYHHYAWASHKLGKVEESVSIYEKAIHIRKTVLGKSHKKVAKSIFNLGISYEDLGDNKKALEKHLEALSIRQELNDPFLISKSYRRLGFIQLTTGDFDRAEEYFKQALLKSDNSKTDHHLYNGKNLNDLGRISYKQGNLEQAISYYKQALSAYKKLENSEYRQAIIANNLANTLLEKGKNEEAKELYQKAIELYRLAYGETSDELAIAYTNLGIYYYEEGEYPAAIKEMEKADAIASDLYGMHHGERALYLLNLADTWQMVPNKNKAKEQYELAIRLLTKHDSKTVPKELNYYKNVGDKELIFLLVKGYAETIKENDKEEALDYYLVCSGIIDLIRKSHTSESAKLFWGGSLHDIYEEGISLAENSYSISGKPRTAEIAFSLIENSKSASLLSSIKDNDALQFSGIPQELLSTLKTIEEEVSSLEVDKFYSEGEEATTIGEEILLLQQERDFLLQKIEKEHPDYYALKFKDDAYSIDLLKNNISENEQVISFFRGGDNIYLFLIEHNQVKFIKLDIKPKDTDRLVVDVLDGIYGYYFSENKSDSLYTEKKEIFENASFELYQSLFSKITLKENITIIPDGILGYLPFEVLTKEKKSGGKFSKYSYLLRDHNIRYSPSLGLLKEMIEKKNQPKYKKILAYAPKFQGKQTAENTDLIARIRGDLGELVFNEKEIERISKIFPTQKIKGEHAIKSHFEKTGKDYSVLHFATHGKANDKDARFSFLAFTPEDESDANFLFVRDLYNYRLNADMVVLSACQTGVGKLQKGEGVMSMARGFSYAGAKSLVTTLWSVNDVQTSKLMTLFYSELSEKKTKELALASAKRKYIEENPPEFGHPYYWAAPILIGDTSPILIKSSPFSSPWVLLGIGLIILVLLFIIGKKLLKK